MQALDLHVLGTPPAFILSQDQTLHKNLNHGHFDLQTGKASLAVKVATLYFVKSCVTPLAVLFIQLASLLASSL